MKSVFHLAVFISTLTLCSSALAGVQIGATRIIYPEKNDEAQLSVKSQNTTISHLVQAWVSNIDDQGEPPFIATPPIIKLGANQETIFHFIYAKKGAELPKDRESVFWANIKFIASTPEELQNKSKLQLASRTRIKLIYRPSTLTEDGASNAYKKITFARKGAGLNISNPTPYYVTLSTVSVNNVKLAAPRNTLAALSMMVAPFGVITLPANLTVNSSIKWNAINDYGSVTESQQTLLP
ncbi:fimbrial biogenesis chaperone [Atlantibacter subterraneus]|jgi:fimbrial chaperone protein|uniref:Molecular chaperone n=1 Tax=Atlantibacter subterraneus TaxID=255519 RepID=A0ABU4E158_9ENTR|nr:molecular chaperone [Atlantibacter subterranea]MDV7022466.1 molecular chaperone [Atlantibacter subterranea]MDW2742546.1 molecular chaperone [Atlantibacter subterranea]MDZ5665664.1 molecular chaperone [Atlantibacter hermannii]